ncbi:hypothetical protein AD998_19785 [bacterium 336/3]|nr:hypothetical protein AD998_19785 [bacterium 336/3]
MKVLKIILLLLILVVVPYQVSAEPLYIEFGEMISKTKTIVIAEYLGAVNPNAEIIDSYKLLVKEVIWGTVKEKIMIVKRAQGGVEYGLTPNTICIAFINQDDGFEWVATPHQKGADIQTSSLYLRGFYDYNAYLVYPSLVTVHQIREYLQKGSMSYHLKGNLHFFSTEEKKMKAGKTSFDVEYIYQPKNSKSTIKTENLPIKDFPKQGSASLGAWQEPAINIVYESNLIRPLKFGGRVQSLKDGKNTFEVLFYVEELDEINEKMFLEYLNQESYGYLYYEVLVQTEDGENFKLMCQENKNGEVLINSKGERYRYKSFSDNRIIFNYKDGKELILEYIPLNMTQEQLLYTRGVLAKFIRQLKISTLHANIYEKDSEKEKLIGKYTLVLKRTHFGPNLNFKPSKK